MMHTKFSFILPAWKGRYLREAIRSILGQSYRDFELIVVDDCSPEPLKEIVGEFQDTRVEYYRNEHNIGGKDLVAQWNHCLQYAHGDYVILATDDDLYEPRFLEEMARLIDLYPEVDLLRSRIMQITDDGTILGMDGYYKERETFAEFVYNTMHGMKSGIPQYVFRRTALVEAGGFVSFPKAWAADDASAIRMARNGMAFSNRVFVNFRLSSGINITSDQSIMPIKTKAMLMYYEWLKGQLATIKATDPYTDFLFRNTVGFLSIYAKQMIMCQVGPTPILRRLHCLLIIMKGKEFSLRDKLSILLHTLIRI